MYKQDVIVSYLYTYLLLQVLSFSMLHLWFKLELRYEINTEVCIECIAYNVYEFV